MELDYWEQFMYTGRVEDYLSYKNAGSVPKTACTYEEKEAGVDVSERDDHGHRNGAFCISDR
ncbi:MAG TPA: hypothetical protein DCZ20_05340 [Lachnospiraceae bacterium]|nr:hypothetical protein [Lachnospiraceae bacterium]